MLGKMMVFIAATVGGAIGWWAGNFVGFMTAFIVSTIGSGVGIWAGRRLAREYDL